MVFNLTVTSGIGALVILLATTDIISQDICLGHFEYHFDKSGGNQVCTRGWLILRIWCWITAFEYLSVASNIPESYMLYYCFKAIQQQTEKSRESLGQESYSTRKRYFLDFSCIFFLYFCISLHSLLNSTIVSWKILTKSNTLKYH